MTIYNLYMNNAEPLTPYDLITVVDSNSCEIVWNRAFLISRQNIHTKRLRTFTFKQSLITVTLMCQFKKEGAIPSFFLPHTGHLYLTHGSRKRLANRK